MSPGRSRPRGVPLLLDEMHAPVVAETLRRRGFDVIAVVAEPELRALSDPELLPWATEHGRRIVTENVKDFRALLREFESTGEAIPSVLFTTSRTFPRTRRNPGPLIEALSRWLVAKGVLGRPSEDWLTGDAG